MKIFSQKNKKLSFLVWAIIGVFLFSLGLIFVFAILTSWINLNKYNKDEIIALNLAEEQLELFRNIRDSNYNKIYNYNQIDPSGTYYEDVFETGSYYKIENDYSKYKLFPIKVEKIEDFWEWISELESKMKDYKLCLDSENRYVYDCQRKNTQTYFYRYLKLEELKYLSGSTEEIIDDAYKVTSKVIWYNRWYHEIELKTIVTDWRRL